MNPTGEPLTVGPATSARPDGLASDPTGDTHVAEVTWPIKVRPGLVRPDCHTLQIALAR
jgi:hypothetical protein